MGVTVARHRPPASPAERPTTPHLSSIAGGLSRSADEGGATRSVSMVAPRPTALAGHDIVCFSNDWSGDPLSKMHLMRLLARSNRILWVNSIGNRVPRASTRDARRIANRFIDFARGLQEPVKNLYVQSPIALPLYGPTATATNSLLLRAQIRSAMRVLGMSHPISWSFLPAAASVAGTLGERLVVYHVVDDFAAFSDAPAAQIATLEKRLAHRADIVIASSDALYERFRRRARTVLVRHGVERAHFARALDPSTAIPDEATRWPKPILGFFGLIADWVDLDLVGAVARAFPQGTVALVGEATTELSPLAGLDNVRLVGRRPYDELPRWCKAFDVALMPFRVSPLTLAANPLKVREYLAAGLPVVSTPLPEVEHLGLCRIGHTTEDFLREIRASLGASPGSHLERSLAMREETWEARLEDISRHLTPLLASTSDCLGATT